MLQLTMVWAGGWVGWSPEEPSNPSCSVTPGFSDVWDADLSRPLGCCIYSAAQPAGLPSHTTSVWPTEALGRSQEWLPKRPSPGSFPLAEEHKPPEAWSAVSGAGSGSQPRAQGRLSRILRWARAELSCVQAQPALPCSPLPAGQLGWGREGDSSRKLHPGVPSAGSRLCCPRTGVGRHRGASAPSSFSSPPMPLPRAVREPVPKKSWLVLNNLIVTEMWNDRRVSPRKVCFLNHYSIMLLHGTQKITPRAFSSSRLSG